MLDVEAVAGAHLREAVGAVQHVPSTLLSSTFPRFRMLPWYRSLLAFATRLEVTCMRVGRWNHGMIALKPAGQRHSFSSMQTTRRQQQAHQNAGTHHVCVASFKLGRQRWLCRCLM
jgi:hypothetical protein